MATADRETTDREPESPRTPESPALPNARLNPLLNPLLAKQLGRWAHIYYTASVDKREAAIEKLVSELEAEEKRLNGGGRLDAPRVALPVALPAAPETVANPILAGKVPVPTSQPDRSQELSQELRNVAEPFAEKDAKGPPVGRQRDLDGLHLEEALPRAADLQREIGVSGVALHGVSIDSLPQKHRPLAEVEKSAFHPVPESHDLQEASPEPTREPVAETIPESWQELLGSTHVPDRDHTPSAHRGAPVRTSEVHPDDPPHVSQDAVAYSHAFDDILAQSEQIQMHQTPTRSGRLPIIVLIILCVFGGAFWWIQGGRLHLGALEQARKTATPTPQPSTTQTSAAQPDTVSPATGEAPSPTTAPPAAAAPANAAPSQQSQPASTAHVPGLSAATQAPATKAPIGANGVANHDRPPGSEVGTKSPSTPQAQASVTRPPEDTAPLPPDLDFEAGMRELQGPGRNSADAARHLWLSVKNQNSSALVPLAQLYANGDGVTKDCDQAKVLLDAATRQAKSRTQFLKAEMSRASLRTAGCD